MRSNNVKMHPRTDPWSQVFSTRPFELPGSKIDMTKAKCKGQFHPNEDLDPFFVDGTKVDESEVGEFDEDGRSSQKNYKVQITRESKELCASCPIRTECLEYALTNRIDFGVWGGMTARERRKLLKQR